MSPHRLLAIQRTTSRLLLGFEYYPIYYVMHIGRTGILNLAAIGFQLLAQNHSLKPSKAPQLQMASRKFEKLRVIKLLHACVVYLHIQICFGFVENFIVHLFVQTLMIYWCSRNIFPAEVKFIPWHLWPVEIRMRKAETLLEYSNLTV